MKVDCDDKDYLDHDSHLDCSNIIELSHSLIEEALNDDEGDYLGEMDDVTFEEAKKKLAGANTISPIAKKKYGLDKYSDPVDLDSGE